MWKTERERHTEQKSRQKEIKYTAQGINKERKKERKKETNIARSDERNRMKEKIEERNKD